MTRLLTLEWRKLFPYRTFWIILLLYMALLLLFLYSSSHVVLNGKRFGNDFYRFPDIWMRLSYIASYFNLLLGILMITLITDEYSFRSFRQQVIDGLSRADLVQGKLLVVLALALGCTAFLTLAGLGFGIPNTPQVTFNLMLQDALHLVYYLVQAIGYMSLAVLFGFLIRKNGLAILAFLLYAKVLEPLVHWRLADEWDKYFPMKVFSSLTPMPGQEILDSLTGPTVALAPPQAVVPALLYSLVFYLLAYLLLKNRDL